MKDQRIVMGMPVTVEIVGGEAEDVDEVFAYFTRIEAAFSPFKAIPSAFNTCAVASVSPK